MNLSKSEVEDTQEMSETNRREIVAGLERLGIRDGDTVLIRADLTRLGWKSRDLRTGDVVVFKTPDKILAHRLIHRKNRGEGKNRQKVVQKSPGCRFKIEAAVWTPDFDDFS